MSPGKRVVVLVLLVVSCLIAYTSRPLTASATAGINSQMSFTGKLVKSDNTNITDGTYNMEFKVYQDGTSAGVGSTLMWTEDYLVAGSTGMPSTGGVTFSSGTFSVNLGSICAFAGGTCGAKTNTGVDFNQNTLWASIQIGNSTSCTVTSSTTSFNTACGGDGEMSPYIRLTAVPYAANAALLSGIAVTALGQLAGNLQTWTGTNTFGATTTFQSTANTSSALVKQTSVGSPTADIFNVQTANATTLLQFTGPSANTSNVTLQAAGSAGTLTLNAAGTGVLTIGNTGTASNIQIGNTTGAVAQTINIGNNTTASSTSTLLIGSNIGSSSTTLQGGTGGVIVKSSSANDATLGSELYPTNNFATDFGTTTGWDVTTSTQATHTAGNTNTITNTTVAITASNIYQVGFTLGGTCGTSSDTITATIGGQTLSGGALTGDKNCSGAYSYIITAANTNKIAFTPTTSWTGTISAVTIKQITNQTNTALTVKNSSSLSTLEVRSSGTASNIFIGLNSGKNNTSTGSSNTAVGSYTLQNNTTGFSDTASGTSALQNNTTGSNNVAVGSYALQNNTTGFSNTASGSSSLYNNTTGTGNTASGSSALQNNTTGTSNVAVGSYALQNNTTGYSNTASGSSSLFNNTTGSSNVAVGVNALQNNTTGYNNTAVGNSAGFGAASNGAIGNSLFGFNSGNALQTGANNNTLIGYNAGDGITIGTNNVVIGFNAGTALSSGSNNVLIGQGVVAASPTGSNQLQIGTGISGDLSLGTLAITSGSATAFLIQDASSNAALAFDAGNSILKVYENVASPTNYASISYAGGTAIFGSSSGATQFGAGTGGNVNILLTGTADQMLVNKTNTLAAAYSTSDFKFTRQLTAGAFAATGNVLTVEDVSTIGAGSSAPNVLYVDQLNTSATGNLILAQTGGGANNKFAVNTAGTVTIAAGQSYTGGGALTLQSAATTALTVDSGTTGTLNVGTSANNKAINLGAIGTTAAADTLQIATTTGAAQNIDIGGTGTTSSTSNAATTIALQGGATVLNVANGGANIITYTNSTSAFQLQSSDTSIIANFDTSGGNANNLITTLTANGSENFTAGSTTGWIGALNGTAGTCTLTAVTAATASPAGVTPTNGNYMGQCANTATAGAEFKYTTGALTASTVYTFDFYAAASSIGAANVATILDFGHVENAGGENVAGLSMTSQVIAKNGWTHYSLTFKTGATLAAGDYLYIKQNDATARSIWIDGITLQTDPNADNNYREGKVQLFGPVTSSLILQNTTNSSTAFQVENSSGAAVFTINTVDTNLLPNPGAEVNAVGWSGKGAAGASIIRDTTQQKFGYAAFKITTTAASGDGAQFTGLSLPFGAAQSYSVSFSVKNSGTAFGAAGLVAGITNTAGDTNCVLAPAISATVPITTGWTRFTCTIGPITTTVGTAFYIKTAETVAHIFWVDGIELDSGTTLTPYGVGSLSLNGVIDTPMYLQNKSDSNLSLALFNTAGATIFSVDSLNKIVQIGSGIADATQVNLQLDSSNVFTETGTCSATVNQGAMYFNTASNAIRACINGAWEDMMSTAGMGILSFGVVADTGSNPGDLASLVTPGVTGPCKVSWASTTTVTVAPCSAYSGGRKVIVSSTTLTLTTTTTNLYENVCLTGTNGAPALVGPATTQTSATIMPTFSAASPILCLATLRNSTTVSGNFTGGTAGQIYDTRTFTQTVKEFQTTAAALGLGYIAMASTTGVTIATNTAGTGGMRGVVVASNGGTSSTNPNVILAISGPTYIPAIAASAAAGYVIVGGTTQGYAGTSATLTFPVYAYLGMSRTTFVATCTSAATCIGSIYTDLTIR